MVETVQPPTIASAHSGMLEPILPLASERNVPGAVHHHPMLHDVRIRAAILLDVVGVVLHDADRAVAAVGGVAVGARQRVGGVDREPALEPPLQLELQRVELAFAGVLR